MKDVVILLKKIWLLIAIILIVVILLGVLYLRLDKVNIDFVKEGLSKISKNEDSI